MRIPLSAPDIDETDIEAVTQVLRTSSLSLGPRLDEFERAVANYVGASYAVAVNSGTSGLHLCIRALGIGEGDEVIVPSFAFIAVANAVRYERAKPVFVDVDPEMLNLDPDRIEAAITPRTRAILVVHTFGCPAELSEIGQIARRHGLFVIEDGCEAIGAEYGGRKVGVQGRGDPEEWLQHTELGYNYRISEMNCALGIQQLKRIETILHRRQSIAQEYDSRLNAHSDLKLPLLIAPRRRLSWFVYVVRLGAVFAQSQRDWIARELALRGIGCGRYFAPIHLQPIYRSDSDRRVDLQVTESNAARSLALPFFNRIEANQIDEVCQSLVELMQRARRLLD
jgi:perosamine synthetase